MIWLSMISSDAIYATPNEPTNLHVQFSNEITTMAENFDPPWKRRSHGWARMG